MPCCCSSTPQHPDLLRSSTRALWAPLLGLPPLLRCLGVFGLARGALLHPGVCSHRMAALGQASLEGAVFSSRSAGSNPWHNRPSVSLVGLFLPRGERGCTEGLGPG